MSMKVTVSELRDHLPDILDRAVKDDQPCIIERGGKTYAVIVSARQWRRETIGARLDALGPEYKLTKEKQARAEELLSESKRRPLTRNERRELNTLLVESEKIMLRRAGAMGQ